MAAEHPQQHPEANVPVSPDGGAEPAASIHLPAKAAATPPPPAAHASPADSPPAPGPSLVPPAPKPRMGWGRRIEKIVLALFCLEVGGFLLIFPWVPQWSDNYFFSAAEQLRPLFLSPYFRGAISGLGALNLYLAIVESIDFLGSFLDT